jgi:hypothetical protein
VGGLADTHRGGVVFWLGGDNGDVVFLRIESSLKILLVVCVVSVFVRCKGRGSPDNTINLRSMSSITSIVFVVAVFVVVVAQHTSIIA